MAAKKQAAKARSAAEGASPYVQRVIEDAELRENVRVALDNAKKAYARLTNGKPATKVLDDKKLHKEVRQAAESLRDAGQALREGPKKKKKRGGFGKLLLVGIVGAGAALALSEGLRNKVLDTLFGAEEEFDYTSTTAPAPAGETVSSSS
jgi:hypothetical protein